VANKMSEKKKSSNQSEMEEPKSAKATASSERVSSKPVKREVKAKPASSSSSSNEKKGGWRNQAAVRFIRESYRELRYKVTWPTFVEARNMTITVIALSTVIGLVLGLFDAGLFQLFKIVTGK
jgi:preprotein translocase SecE subunit